MSQRNPMNERYTTDERIGKTRKSAAAAKPKSQAAASVVVKKANSQKTAKEKKAAQKAERKKAQAKQRELDRKYYTPDTDRYRKLRKLWWALLICAILCTVASFFLRGSLPEGVSMAILIGAYLFIIAAFYVDFAKIRKERMAYQDRMLALEEQQKREEKAAQRAAASKGGKKGKKNVKVVKAAEAAAEEEAAPGEGEGSEEAKPAKKRLFRLKKAETPTKDE